MLSSAHRTFPDHPPGWPACGRCRARPARDGARSCQHCLDESQMDYEARKAVGVCVTCGKADASAGNLRCPPCVERIAAYNRGIRARAAASGKCTRCHRRKPREGKRYCATCVEDGKIYKAMRRLAA
jgi:hypothetical protein